MDKELINRPCWFVYMVRCSDGTIYTGITTDLARRLAEHNSDDRKGARYTRWRRPVELAYREVCGSRSLAARREYQLKRLPPEEKRKLCPSLY